MIEVSQLSKKFKNSIAVDKISFQVAAGEKLILLGTSGSGKTTTLKMLNRLIEPDSGEIWLEGQKSTSFSVVELRRKIGYVIQQFGLFPHYTVAQNIALVPQLLTWDKSKIKARVLELLEMMNLNPDEFYHRFPHELSGGQKQRVGIARALAANPAILLLDEPLGALDPITRHQIQQELKRILNVSAKTAVMVTHDVFEAIELGDTIALLDNGVLQQIGKAQELLFSPANEIVLEFFRPYHFQLSLKLKSIEDILPKLYTIETTDVVDKIFNQKEDLLAVFQYFSASLKKNEFVGIANASKEIIIKTNKEILLKAMIELI